jgi:hypothetical protein
VRGDTCALLLSTNQGGIAHAAKIWPAAALARAEAKARMMTMARAERHTPVRVDAQTLSQRFGARDGDGVATGMARAAATALRP